MSDIAKETYEMLKLLGQMDPETIKAVMQALEDNKEANREPSWDDTVQVPVPGRWIK